MPLVYLSWTCQTSHNSHISCEMESSRRAGKFQTRINQNEQLYQTPKHKHVYSEFLYGCMEA
jgi:hypothetical protein